MSYWAPIQFHSNDFVVQPACSLKGGEDLSKTIRVKRVYAPPEPDDGKRFLVDRIWPRGLKKDSAQLDGWLSETAPSTQLRKWFAHDPARWNEFVRRYHTELNQRPEAWQPLLEAAKAGTVTLLFAARDEQHNNAVALKAFLDAKLKRNPRR